MTGRKRRQKPETDYLIDMTPSQVTIVKGMIDIARRKSADAAGDIFTAFPEFKKAVDALPDGRYVLDNNVIMREMIAHGLRVAGVEVPSWFGVQR